MADDPRIKYLDTRKSLDNAMAGVTQISTTISKFSKALQANPWHIDMQHGLGSSAHHEQGVLKSFDPETWPTGKQIISKLTNMHNLYQSLQVTWNSIAEADRKNLERPADLLGKFHP
ncbi:MAG: hypothetical protein ABSF74_03815 [Dehalococcoidia bacterium]|jgi:hypothetical protein